MKTAARRAVAPKRASGRHERQAIDVAGRYGAGERRLARHVSPVVAANFALASSPGTLLEPFLRADLEHAFDAGLDAVRVHRDAYAGRAARAEQAYAFASGSHVYFADGAYAPYSRAGRQLIAHEITHVLQQTGRVGFDGRLHAVDTAGAGDLQRAWASPLASTDVIPSIDDVLAEHLADVDATAPEHQLIERLQNGFRSAGTAAQPAFLVARVAFVVSDTVDPVFGMAPSALPALAASALYDALKAGGQFTGAARLLHARRDLRTRFFSAETYQAYMDEHATDFAVAKQRFYHHWYTHPWFGHGNPRFMLDRTLIFLIGLSARLTPQTVANGDELSLTATTELRKINTTGFHPDELYFVTVKVARDVEIMRVGLLEAAVAQARGLRGFDQRRRAEAKATISAQVLQKVEEAQRLRDAALANVPAHNRAPLSRESFLLWFGDVLPALEGLARYATNFWGSVAGFESSLRADAPIHRLTARARDVLGRIDVELPQFRPVLEAFLHRMLDREADGTLPTPQVFEGRRDAAVQTLDRDLAGAVERPLADRLIDALPSERDRGAFSFDAAAADRLLPPATRAMVAWAESLASHLRDIAREYSRADDDAMVARQRAIEPTAPAADLRSLIRIKLAAHMFSIARLAGWTAWVDWLEPILSATELVGGQPMTVDYLILPTYWKRDPNAAITLMNADLPQSARGFEPMTTRDLVEFYQAEDYRAISRHIDLLLQIRGGVYSAQDPPVLNEAVASAQNEERPRRDVIEQARHIHPWTEVAGSRRPAPRSSFLELLREHPLTKAKVAEERQLVDPLTWAVGATQVAGVQAAVLWTMPSPLELIARIQTLPAANVALLAGLTQVLAVWPTDPTSSAAQLRAAIESGEAFLTPAPGEPAPGPVTLANLTPDLLVRLELHAWWTLWRAVLDALEGISPAAREAALARMRAALEQAGLPQALKQEREAAYRQYERDEQRALVHERRRIVEVQLKPTLQNFQRHSWDEYQIPGGGRVYKRLLATETARLLRQFVILLPEHDREAHLAMALLEMSDVVAAKLGGLTDVREFYVWGPLIDDALLWANDANKGGNADVRRSFTTPGEQGNDALFDTRRAALTAALTHIAAQFEQHYERWGVVARQGDGTIENPGSVHAVDEEHRALSRGTVFAHEGRTYEVAEVKTAFTFHPGAAHFRSLPSGTISGSRLIIGGTEYSERNRPHTLLMYVLLDGNPELTPVWADGPDTTDLLSRMTWALHMYATLQQLGELATAIEVFGEILMTAAELFPGGGQALAAARIMTGVMQVAASDIPAMVVDLVTNPTALLNSVWERLQGLLSLGNLLEYFLFNNKSLNGLLNRPRQPGNPNPGRSTSRRMRKLMLKLQTLMRGAGRAVAKVQDAVQDRRQGVEHFVQGSPRTVRFIQMVADYYLVLASIADFMAQLNAEGREDAIREFGSPASFAAPVNRLVDSIGHIQLPEEILPLHELIDTLIDLVGHRIGGKYKLGVRILMELLDLVGLRAEVVSTITLALQHAGVTTENIFPQWKNDIVPGIAALLQNAQSSLRNSLNDAFSQLGIDLDLAQPTARVELSGSDFPDAPADLPAGVAEGSPLLEEAVQAGIDRRGATGRLDVRRASELLRSVPDQGGEPLSERMRERAERVFGQDFGHVRLHADARTSGLLRGIGARGLTSGSHVLLTGPPTESRTPVLYHELAHVVQQSGMHPIGSRPRPRRGRPGRGLRLDPRAESEARAAAAAAVRGSARGTRVSAAGDGMQPSLIDVIGQRFLRQVTDINVVQEEAAEIERTGATTGARLIGRDVRRAVSGVDANLRTKFHRGPNALWARRTSSFAGNLDQISSHLLANHRDIAEAIEDIAIRASYEAERARGGRPPRMALNISDFTRRLERFIFGKTGILLELEADTRGHGRDATFVSTNAPYKKAEVKYVFLAVIHGNSRLWTDALEYRSHLGRPKTAIPPSERAAWRTQIRAVLRHLGPSSAVWVGGEYRLSAGVFDAAEELTRLQQTGALSGTLPPTSLATPQEYVLTTSATLTPPFGNQRLHLGTYSQKQPPGEQKGKERESHHLTQYLLVEYFHNGKSGTRETNTERIGFPLLLQDRTAYGSDLHLTGGRPGTFRDIEIADLEIGRGGKMPTILLARGTHRRGNLHISPQGDDFDDTSTSTQAAAVNHMYKSKLPGTQRDVEREVAAGRRPYRAWEQYVTANPNFGSKIYEAMQDTYAEIRHYMAKQLATGLATIERDYYNDMYLAGHPGSTTDPMTRQEMKRVATLAEEHNRAGASRRGIKGMRDYGWRA
jgi:hypothetical protein